MTYTAAPKTMGSLEIKAPSYWTILIEQIVSIIKNQKKVHHEPIASKSKLSKHGQWQRKRHCMKKKNELKHIHVRGGKALLEAKNSLPATKCVALPLALNNIWDILGQKQISQHCSIVFFTKGRDSVAWRRVRFLPPVLQLPILPDSVSDQKSGSDEEDRLYGDGGRPRKIRVAQEGDDG